MSRLFALLLALAAATAFAEPDQTRNTETKTTAARWLEASQPQRSLLAQGAHRTFLGSCGGWARNSQGALKCCHQSARIVCWNNGSCDCEFVSECAGNRRTECGR